MQVIQSEVHPTGKFWVAWAARDVVLMAAAGTFFVGGSYWRSPQTQPPSTPGAPVKAVVTSAPTPIDPDRELARKIRKAMANEGLMASAAENIKIVVRKGIVTLKGVVHSEEEESAVVSEAAEIAGASNIRSEITVEPEESPQAAEETARQSEEPQPQSQELQ